MKLKLGLYNKDLAVRFCIALFTVTKIVKTWINLIYIRLGSISIFPSRDIIIRNMTQDFKEQYPTTIISLEYNAEVLKKVEILVALFLSISLSP